MFKMNVTLLVILVSLFVNLECQNADFQYENVLETITFGSCK